MHKTETKGGKDVWAKLRLGHHLLKFKGQAGAWPRHTDVISLIKRVNASFNNHQLIVFLINGNNGYMQVSIRLTEDQNPG
ncbi:hypothetical protein [Spirosoma aerophilum]